jgi:protein-S-isoprenylcysteine O-methyltransferase Ste14
MRHPIEPAPEWLTRIGGFFFKYRNAAFPMFFVVAAIVLRPHYPAGEEWDDVLDVVGVALALVGQAFRGLVIGLAYIKRGGLNKKVYADALVTTGLFAACRNPLYVGNAFILGGLTFIFNDPIVYVLAAAFFGFAYWSIIRTEETFLLDKFGWKYERYCIEVRRWWPSPRRVVAAFRGARFNWRRVILKDYSTFAGWVAAALLIEALEEVTEGVGSALAIASPYLGVVTLVVILTLAVRAAKKAGVLGSDLR